MSSHVTSLSRHRGNTDKHAFFTHQFLFVSFSLSGLFENLKVLHKCLFTLPAFHVVFLNGVPTMLLSMNKRKIDYQWMVKPSCQSPICLCLHVFACHLCSPVWSLCVTGSQNNVTPFVSFCVYNFVQVCKKSFWCELAQGKGSQERREQGAFDRDVWSCHGSF